MRETAYEFDERLAYAATPPSDWYTDPRMLEMEKQRVFARTWQLVGRADQVAEPGQYFTTSIADEPIIVVRDQEARLRAFSNVCRHRAGPVAAGEGARRVFQCKYHGWTYSLDGRLLGTPEFEGVERWDKKCNSLPEFKVEALGTLIFVNLDPQSSPLSETLEGIPGRIGRGFDWQSMSLAHRKDWHVECNWKVYVDNYLEGYHIPIVHPSLNRAIDYPNYQTETKKYYSLQHSPIRPGRAYGSEGDSDEGRVLYFWVYPNLMLNVYPDNFSTNLIVPLGPERTLTIFEWYFRNPELPQVQEAVRRTVAFSDEVQVEDIAICEAVQRGLRSRTYRSGRYSVKRENGVHHFHGLLAKFLKQP